MKVTLELNNANAMIKIANMYMSGEDIEQDYEKAKELYEQACELEDSRAMVELGKFYYYGYINKDTEKASELFKRAAELGNTNAFMCLQVCVFMVSKL